MTNNITVDTGQNKELVRTGFFDQGGFELLQRVAKALSSSELVPKQFQGNIANCMIAMDIANRIGANPLMVMQNLYVVHGTPSWSSKFLVATINACGRFSSLRYEWRGQEGTDEYGCRAWAIEKETSERLDGIWITAKMVKAEGWASKNGSKWKTMPDQMFVYRAAAFWQRAYAPEIGMGLMTSEEAHDIIEINQDGTIKNDSVPTNYPQDQFDHELDMLQDIIKSGKKPVNEVIATLESIAPLTQDQKMTLASFAPNSTEEGKLL